MPLLNVLIMVFCSWLLLLAITGAIEHVRMRRDEHRARWRTENAPTKRAAARAR
jgi:hypothetical protein